MGTVIDPMADKTLMTILTVALAVKGALPGEWLLFPPGLTTRAARFIVMCSCHETSSLCEYEEVQADIRLRR